MINNYIKIYVSSNGEIKFDMPIKKENKSNTIDLNIIEKIQDSTLSPFSKAILNAQINSIIRK